MHCPPACLTLIGRRLRHEISLSLHVEALGPMVLMNASPLCPPSWLQVRNQRQEFLLLPRHDDGKKHAVMQGNTHLPTPRPPPPPHRTCSFIACPLDRATSGAMACARPIYIPKLSMTFIDVAPRCIRPSHRVRHTPFNTPSRELTSPAPWKGDARLHRVLQWA
jgi:hypothetical protein